MLVHFKNTFGAENVQSRGGIGGEGHCGDLWLKQGDKTILVELKDAAYKWEHVRKAVTDAMEHNLDFVVVFYASLGVHGDSGHQFLTDPV
eukprot:scaffold302406_cov27-Tisochrysis_lutea.AAC.1